MLSWIERAEWNRSGRKNSTTSSRPALRRLNSSARRDDPVLHPLVDDAQSLLRRHQAERERQQPGLVVVPDRRQAAIRGLGDQRLELRQLVGADEAVLVEQRAVGRDPGEQLDHQLRDPGADGVEVVQQPHLAQQRDEFRIARQVRRLEIGTAGRAEQQVLGDAQVGVVRIGIEELDVRGEVVGAHAVPDRRPRLERHRREGRLRLAVRGARQAVAADFVRHVDQSQDRDRGPGQLVGVLHARPRRSRSSRPGCRTGCCRPPAHRAPAAARACASASSYTAGTQGPMLQSVVEVVRERAREDVCVLRRERDRGAPAPPAARPGN